MTEYDIKTCYDSELFDDGHEVTDLHAFYMSQFNLELESNNKNKIKEDSFKYGVEESFDFEVLDSINDNVTSVNLNDLKFPINEDNIKEVLLDLDSIEFDDVCIKDDSDSKKEQNYYDINNEYIDDESLIDELCREEGENHLAPEELNDELFTVNLNEKPSLPSIESAFSKRYCNFNYNIEEDNQNVFSENNIVTNLDNNISWTTNLDQYSYPNNVLHSIENEKNYILPDTPTSCTEFNFTRERKVSVSDSIESDVQSSSYYDDNSETFDEDELFVNLDEFGLTFEADNEITDINNSASTFQNHHNDRKHANEKTTGERTCFWEHCYQRYPNQNALVEHIESAHVNTYKGEEFSCLWRECLRARRPFNARYKLLIHMRVHSGHKPNRCHHPGCGKAFSRLENLKIHVRSHTGERPYACPAPHCRKAFSNSSDRAKHQRTHFNARPYACGASGCGKRYTDPSSLRKHVKSHPHIVNVPRTCIPATKPSKSLHHEQAVPTSPAKLTTLKCIREKLTVPRLQRL